MNAKRQRGNWWLDALLLGGFLLAMLLDLTGLSVHQWLGIAIPVMAGYHLLRHWQWVKAVSERLLGSTSANARRAYALDAGLLFGLLCIVLTGLVISTWFNLNLAHYAAWRAFHVLASVVTLGVLVVKIALHWRWIVSTARRYVLPPRTVRTPGGELAPEPVRVGRRDFIGLMAAVGALSLLAGAQALTGEARATDETSQPGTGLTSDAGQSSSGASCTVACNRRCSYPGQCRRYQDSNGNGRCDLGECGSGGNAVGSGSGGFDGQTRPYRIRSRRG